MSLDYQGDSSSGDLTSSILGAVGAAATAFSSTQSGRGTQQYVPIQSRPVYTASSPSGSKSSLLLFGLLAVAAVFAYKELK